MFEQGTVYKLSCGHYYFILSNPTINPECIVVVNMTTYYNDGYDDESCVLYPGDHPVVFHKSWIKYDRADIRSLKEVRRWLANGTIQETFNDCDSNLISKIIQGSQTSPFTPKKVLRCLEEQGLILW